MNGTPSTAAPIQISFPLPRATGINVYLHLTKLHRATLLFLTTSSAESSASATSLGSFVYAIPNRLDQHAPPLSTPLYTQPSTLDFATRLATLLARKTAKPAYVGNSVSFAAAGRGGDVEEEMEGFTRIVDVVMAALEGRLEADED